MKRKALVAFTLLVAGAALGHAQAAATPTSKADPGITRLNFATILVRDYDEALHWYTEVLGFTKLRDQSFGAGHRWVVVAPKGQKEIGIVLAMPRPLAAGDKTADHMDRLGKETNWVFQVEDVRRLYETLSARGVKFVEKPTDQPWGTVQAVFEDLYGNIFVVESPRTPKAEAKSAPGN
jgi:uncharacterized glyoxalase superfamily protein PhnB